MNGWWPVRIMMSQVRASTIGEGRHDGIETWRSLGAPLDRDPLQNLWRATQFDSSSRFNTKLADELAAADSTSFRLSAVGVTAPVRAPPGRNSSRGGSRRVGHARPWQVNARGRLAPAWALSAGRQSATAGVATSRHASNDRRFGGAADWDGGQSFARLHPGGQTQFGSPGFA